MGSKTYVYDEHNEDEELPDTHELNSELYDDDEDSEDYEWEQCRNTMLRIDRFAK